MRPVIVARDEGPGRIPPLPEASRPLERTTMPPRSPVKRRVSRRRQEGRRRTSPDAVASGRAPPAGACPAVPEATRARPGSGCRRRRDGARREAPRRPFRLARRSASRAPPRQSFPRRSSQPPGRPPFRHHRDGTATIGEGGLDRRLACLGTTAGDDGDRDFVRPAPAGGDFRDGGGRQRGRRTRPRERREAALCRQSVQRSGETEDVVACVGEIDDMGSGAQRRLGQAIVGLLEGARAIDDDAGRQCADGCRDIFPDVESDRAQGGARLRSGREPGAERFGPAKRARTEQEFDIDVTREMRREPAAEDAGRADQQDARHVRRGARNGPSPRAMEWRRPTSGRDPVAVPGDPVVLPIPPGGRQQPPQDDKAPGPAQMACHGDDARRAAEGCAAVDEEKGRGLVRVETMGEGDPSSFSDWIATNRHGRRSRAPDRSGRRRRKNPQRPSKSQIVSPAVAAPSADLGGVGAVSVIKSPENMTAIQTWVPSGRAWSRRSS